jgi:hypothetical protein
MNKRKQKKLAKQLAERIDLEYFWMGEESAALEKKSLAALRRRKYKLSKVLGRAIGMHPRWISLLCEKLSWRELRQLWKL